LLTGQQPNKNSMLSTEVSIMLNAEP
jgi:hypothetical protein